MQCVVTSPPYWGLRDYSRCECCTSGKPNPNCEICSGSGILEWMRPQIGVNSRPEAYVSEIVAVFREAWRVLKRDGTVWINLGDSYNAAGRDGHGTRQGFKQGTNRASANGSDESRPNAPGLKPKDLVGIPWRVAFALQADGWYLRSDIIWSKPNPMPESVADRPTKSHEYIFLLSKSERYYYDQDAIREPQTGNAHSRGHGDSPKGKLAEKTNRANSSFHLATAQYVEVPGGRNRRSVWTADDCALPTGKHSKTDPQAPGRRMTENVARARANGGDHDAPFGDSRNCRSVWTIATQPYSEAHFATFPPALITPCILAGSRPGDIVLDPFCGSGTTVMTARDLGRHGIGIDLGYQDLAKERIYGPLFAGTVNQ